MPASGLVDGSVNVRDLVGVPVHGLPGPAVVQPGRLLRGESFHVMGPAAVDDLIGRGVGVIVDLRGRAESDRDGASPRLDAAVADGRLERFVVEFVPSDQWRRSPAGRDPYNNLPEAYFECLRGGAGGLAAALTAAVHANRGMYVHCAIGKDRTGAAVAVLLRAVGVPLDRVLADYVASAPALPALARKLAGNPAFPEFADPDFSQLTPRADTLRGFLARVDAAGGPRAVLAAAGVDDDLLAAFRDFLIADR